MPPNQSTAVSGRNDHDLVGANESTPLLGAPGVAAAQENGYVAEESAHAEGRGHAEAEASPENETAKPMPVGQILLLCYASVIEPVAYFSIIPYINEMIHRVGGVPTKDLGFWTGPMEGLFSLVQMTLMIFYGRAADRIGRKPVLVFSLAGISVATALFGCSQTLGQMIFLRCLAGVFAGSVVTTRTMISENCTKAQQAKAFSWYMFARQVGIFVGPLAGGSLANPAELYPNVFGDIAFFRDNPYALASFVAGFVCLTATLATLFGVKETLKRNPSATAKIPLTTWEVLKSPGVPIVLYIFGHIMFLALGYTATAPTMLFERIEHGGCSFSDQYIAGFLVVTGISQAIWMIGIFPSLQKRFGSPRVLQACAIAWPFVLAMFPVLNELLRHDWNLAFWLVGIPGLMLGSGVAIAFGKHNNFGSYLYGTEIETDRTISHSRYPALHQQCLPISRGSSDGQRTGAHGEFFRASHWSDSIHIHIRRRCELTVGGWTSGLGGSDRSCISAKCRAVVPTRKYRRQDRGSYESGTAE
nr:efflux pump azal [Quercus suber]